MIPPLYLYKMKIGNRAKFLQIIGLLFSILIVSEMFCLVLPSCGDVTRLFLKNGWKKRKKKLKIYGPEKEGGSHICPERWGDNEEFQRNSNTLSLCKKLHHISFTDKFISLSILSLFFTFISIFKEWPLFKEWVLVVDNLVLIIRTSRIIRTTAIRRTVIIWSVFASYLHVIYVDCF